ncbi:ribonuclease H2, subunit C [Radiomyces spectabilis]|uniref:ribonuclease H2, subunit C n=1 Tax=Radiomyces spectabilis TaxID=64574 RepID=UPI00221F3EA9|nr:ribonuclease H2, subunit C [Radiomyces spectabilis]KAI8388052.1 ribonuclease H2, subunit C [Radiomyces spectabilis]
MTIANDDPLPTAHLFPFSVQREGPTNAQHYLSLTAHEEAAPQDLQTHRLYSSVVMGRQLHGYELCLEKHNCQGHIWREVGADDQNQDHDEEVEEDQQPQLWEKTGEPISNFVLWKKDKFPSADDARSKALNGWVDIAEAIHAPISLT